MDRPLRSEPLCLDLVDTEWWAAGQRYDYLDDAGRVAEWLAEHGYDPALAATAAEPLRSARTALRDVLERDHAGTLNAVLARGSRTPVLGPDGASDLVQVDQAWRPAWDAAVDYLRLRAERPDRIRRCGHPDCVLYFFDTSRNGTRRWCSMDACGNRAKAGRHYARVRNAP
jgi:predicted RNA-binding Zn ribbon-like protein